MASLYLPQEGMVRKMCVQDLKDESNPPQIKVCKKQKKLFKTTTVKTLRRQFAKNKKQKSPKIGWKLNKINSSNTDCLNVKIWTNEKKEKMSS